MVCVCVSEGVQRGAAQGASLCVSVMMQRARRRQACVCMMATGLAVGQRTNQPGTLARAQIMSHTWWLRRLMCSRKRMAMMTMLATSM